MPYISKSNMQLFKMSVYTTIFPEMWETAWLAPSFKGGDKSERSNCRPISVLLKKQNILIFTLTGISLGKRHVGIMSRKVSRAIRIFKYAKYFLPQNILKKKYISIIVPHFRYFFSVWGFCSINGKN